MSAPSTTEVIRLDADGFCLILEAGQAVVPLFVGPQLPDLSLPDLARLVARGPRECQPDEPQRASLLPQTGRGFDGEPAIVGRTAEGSMEFELVAWEQQDRGLVLQYADRLRRTALTQRVAMLPSGLLSAQAELLNEGPAELDPHWLAALALPLPAWATVALQVHGRWGAEFQLAEVPLTTGRLEKTNRSGRSGFDGAHYASVAEPGCSEEQGRMLAAHLAWSGNCRSFLETLPSGERQLQIGEWLAPGEVRLSPGEAYRTPEALLAFSDAGRNGVRQAFHRELRSRQSGARIAPPIRRVHLNSWEAVYFELDEQKLLALADAAAELGAERFVLDDGWFRGRRDDRSSLGDWTADATRFPFGLSPLIDRVTSLEMDFGLWVEPEMVSPDSDLYREHSDWCLHAPGRDRPTQRHQLVLDLNRAEVFDHLLGVVDELLRTHPIRYLKWDHNRPLFSAESRGAPAAHRQALAHLELLDRLRAKHPSVEIETCASGGGRIDFAIAVRTARAWASDNTDPIERLRIHSAMSLFYPPEYLGAHVGGSPNPTTGRATDMTFRCRAALFSHMGLELDPGKLSEGDRQALRSGVAEYKRFRALIGSGRMYLADTDVPGASIRCVVAEEGAEALLLATSTLHFGRAETPLVRVPGLEQSSHYRITLVEPWPKHAARQLSSPPFWRAQPVMVGAALEEVGLALPLVHPETAWLVHLERVPR